MMESVLLDHTSVWYNNTIMSTLSKLLSSRTRAEILKTLFGLNSKEVHLREITRRAGLSLGAVQDELKKLKGLDLIAIRRDGNRLYCRANTDHPLYPILRQLVMKTDGLAEKLRDRLAGQGFNLAFIYGSIAKGEETAGSDIDLFLAGSITLRALTPKLSGLSEEIGREINPFVITPEELRNRVAQNDHFIGHVLAAPKLFILGDENELVTMGGKRLA